MNDAYAPGQHLLIDFWQAAQPTDLAQVERLLRAAAAACGASVLDVRLHGFGAAGGITGVAILAESHISLHTWPERDFIALDIFLCGQRDPLLALEVLRAALRPGRVAVSAHRRGAASEAD
ncbi:MAG: adenosylmethionine decarboxylase [Hydrogenophilales bacterium 28-61-23]|nr:MAG: adenosylmethionine decarboxylase [Hydrogenophilales bacterium 28-61-23]